MDWNDINETNEAIKLLPLWTSIDMSDSLELLGSFYQHSKIRQFAVSKLTTVSDEDELLAYLLQLIQALRYEITYPSDLSEFLLKRCTVSLRLCTFFYWYVYVETFDRTKGTLFAAILTDFMLILKSNKQSFYKDLQGQIQLIADLSQLSASVNKNRKEKFEKKLINFKQLLTLQGEYSNLIQFSDGYRRIAVRPEICCSGLIGEECSMFKSALSPLLLSFKTIQQSSETNSSNNIQSSSPSSSSSSSINHYKVIFKNGDDLRQDQLVIQIINLMDSLLKKVKLDLQLTPYRVLATSPTSGFVEFIPGSYTLTSILDQYDRNILKFFQFHNARSSVFAAVFPYHTTFGFCVGH